MKVYLIKGEDFDVLLALLDRDPRYGYRGGSSQVLSKQEEEAFKEAHGFYNYQIRGWIDKMKKD